MMEVLVTESWKVLKEIDNYEVIAGELLFRR